MISVENNTLEERDWEPAPEPDVSHLVTEDDTPVDNQFSEKQMRLLTESLHASWKPSFPFIAMANVGVYVALNRPPIVPDVLVKTHVEPLQDLMRKGHRAFFSWQYDGKPPEIVIEIVSNTKGGEQEAKLRNYEHMGVSFYAVFDPANYLSEEALTLYALRNHQYQKQKSLVFEGIPLGLILWKGDFEGVTCTWLRWCDTDGNLLPTGSERADLEANRAALEANRADQETKRATEEAKRATEEARRSAILAAKLRELGVDPDKLV